MSTHDRARRLHDETELLRILVATLLSEVDALVPDAGQEGPRTRVDVLARMITTTAADLDRLASPDAVSPAEMANVVQLPRESATHARTHPVFSNAVLHRGTAGRP